MSKQDIKLGKLKLKNPIILASGTFDKNIAEKIDINKLGGLVTKTITLEPRAGNPLPHIFKTRHGWLNSVGWKNPGIKKYLAEELPFWKKFDTEIIPSIGGFTFSEYIRLASIFDKQDITFLEADISCINTDKVDKIGDQKIIRGIRKIFRGTLIVKLAPDIFNICENAKDALKAGADILTIANTYPAIELKKSKPIFPRAIAGYSGGAIKPVTLGMVWQVYRKLKCPIIASGGVEETQDVLDYLTAGAKAVQVGSANLLDPEISVKIINELGRIK